MSYQGLREIIDETAPHLGGNTAEGNPFAYACAVWDYVIDRFAIHSVLDLGSGLGYSSDYFFRKGLRVIAVDGLEQNVHKAIFPTIQLDLTRASVISRVDLVHCQELVEHLHEAHVPNLLASLQSGRFVLMTHAVPGQPGHHHVNLQPTEYWIQQMEQAGFSHLVEDSNRIRRLAQREGADYFANTGLLFANTRRV